VGYGEVSDGTVLERRFIGAGVACCEPGFEHIAGNDGFGDEVGMREFYACWISHSIAHLQDRQCEPFGRPVVPLL